MIDATDATPDPPLLTRRRTDLWDVHHHLQAVTAARRAWADLAGLSGSPTHRAACRAEALAASRAGTALYQRLTDDVLRLAPYLAPGSLAVELAQERAAQAGDLEAFDAAERILGIADALAEIVVIDPPAGRPGPPRDRAADAEPVGGHD